MEKAIANTNVLQWPLDIQKMRHLDENWHISFLCSTGIHFLVALVIILEMDTDPFVGIDNDFIYQGV